MQGIALLTYAEAKENFNNITLENPTEKIDDDIYGFVINNIFIPVRLEGNNEYLRYDGEMEYLK
ncbi:MAG: hypothetical protein PHT02_00340 [Tissierellia bacterium]|nr:hypothetical protein [Tissierellia bacterium]